MNVDSYLKRINYEGEISTSLNVLKRLTWKHITAVHYENLDMFGGERIRLDLPKIYEDIIVRGLGGFCYELNGLFHWLLKSVGFETYLLQSEFFFRFTNEFGIPFSHIVVMVISKV